MGKLMRSDGNGGLCIPNWFFTVVCIAVAIISSVATVVAMGVNIKNKVDYLQDQSIQQTTDMKEMDTRVRLCESTIPAISARLDNIDMNIRDIKERLK